MSDGNVVKLAQPGAFAHPHRDAARRSAGASGPSDRGRGCRIFRKARRSQDRDGPQRVVRHGHLPEREIMTGIGPVGVRQPRVRDRGAAEAARIRFSPSILPRYARRSRSLEVLIPILYLKGISTGDFEEALAALVGKGAPGLSASTIARLKEVDRGACALAEARSVSQALRLLLGRRHPSGGPARGTAQCILVIIGATPEGRKELVGFTDGCARARNRGVICCSI